MNARKTQTCRYPVKLPAETKLAATLGNFDGLHRGHRALLTKLNDYKTLHPDVKTALISFYPHPAVVLGKAALIPRIIDLQKEVQILTEIGLDYLFLIHFTPDFSKISAEEFLDRILLQELNLKHLVIGDDARVGAEGLGDHRFIKEFCEQKACSVEVVSAISDGEKRVGSRLVRDAIIEGDMRKAATLLDRRFSLRGRVIKGMRNGRAIGFPTANLNIRPGFILPKGGVYATRTHVQGWDYNSVTNIGNRPTLDGTNLSIETHLLNYKGAEIYGQKIEVEFIERIRDEMKFDSIRALIAQIKVDIENAFKLYR